MPSDNSIKLASKIDNMPTPYKSINTSIKTEYNPSDNYNRPTSKIDNKKYDNNENKQKEIYSSPISKIENKHQDKYKNVSNRIENTSPCIADDLFFDNVLINLHRLPKDKWLSSIFNLM